MGSCYGVRAKSVILQEKFAGSVDQELAPKLGQLIKKGEVGNTFLVTLEIVQFDKGILRN